MWGRRDILVRTLAASFADTHAPRFPPPRRLLEAVTSGAGLTALLRTAVDPSLVSDIVAVLGAAVTGGGAGDAAAAAVAQRTLQQLRAARGADTAFAMLSRDEVRLLADVAALAGDGSMIGR